MIGYIKKQKKPNKHNKSKVKPKHQPPKVLKSKKRNHTSTLMNLATLPKKKSNLNHT